jgi:hypothetical protein
VIPFFSVNTKVPSPPVVFFVTTTLPLASFAKLQVEATPEPTTTVTLGLVPGGEPGVQLAATKTKPGFVASLTVYVPGARPPNVAVPTPRLVEIVALMVTLLLSVKTKTPSPPVVFLVTTTEPVDVSV